MRVKLSFHGELCLCLSLQACVSWWTCCLTRCPCWVMSSSSASSSSSSLASLGCSCGQGSWGTAAIQRKTSQCESTSDGPCVSVWEGKKKKKVRYCDNMWLVCQCACVCVRVCNLAFHYLFSLGVKINHTIYSIYWYPKEQEMKAPPCSQSL